MSDRHRVYLEKCVHLEQVYLKKMSSEGTDRAKCKPCKRKQDGCARKQNSSELHNTADCDCFFTLKE